MTLWNCAGEMKNEPLVVMEWKVNHFLNGPQHAKNRDEHQPVGTVNPYKSKLTDVEWLQITSNRISIRKFVGYAVLVESTRRPRN